MCLKKNTHTYICIYILKKENKTVQYNGESAKQTETETTFSLL